MEGTSILFMLLIGGSVVALAAAAIFFLLGVFTKKRRKELVTAGVYFLLLIVGVWIGFWVLMVLIQSSNTYEPADVAGTYQLESDALNPPANDQIILNSDGTFSATSASILKKDCPTGTFDVRSLPDDVHLIDFRCTNNGPTGEFDHTNEGDYLEFGGWSGGSTVRYKRVSEQ